MGFNNDGVDYVVERLKKNILISLLEAILVKIKLHQMSLLIQITLVV